MTFILSCILFLFAPADTHNLELNLKKGVVYTQSTSASTTIKQMINGTEQVIDMEIISSSDFEVVESTEANYLLKSTFRKLEMKMASGMNQQVFSSEKKGDEADIMSQIFAEMTGHTIEMTMSKNGRVEKIEGLDEMYSEIFAPFPELNEMQKEQALSQIRQAYGEDALIGSTELITAIFPEDGSEVEIGDSWSNSLSLEAGMAGNQINNFTLKEVTDEYILIEAASRISTKDQDAYVEIQGMPAKYLLDGKGSSTIKIDPESGWIIDATINQNIDGEVELKDEEQFPDGFTIPMTMTSVTTVTN